MARSGGAARGPATRDGGASDGSSGLLHCSGAGAIAGDPAPQQSLRQAGGRKSRSMGARIALQCEGPPMPMGAAQAGDRRQPRPPDTWANPTRWKGRQAWKDGSRRRGRSIGPAVRRSRRPKRTAPLAFRYEAGPPPSRPPSCRRARSWFQSPRGPSSPRCPTRSALASSPGTDSKRLHGNPSVWRVLLAWIPYIGELLVQDFGSKP